MPQMKRGIMASIRMIVLHLVVLIILIQNNGGVVNGATAKTVPAGKKTKPRANAFMGFPHWIILPNKVGDPLLKGQKMYKPTCVEVDDYEGPKNMPAYVFPGNRNCYVRIESNGKLDFKKSFTIATFVRQEAPYDGPMVEWLGRSPFGTHFWIYKRKTFVNLRPLVRKRGHYWHLTPKSRVWNFVGISYNYEKGTLLMWTGGKTMIQKPGKFDVDTSGKYVYVGLRPRQKNAFRGELAGTTLLKGAIEKKDIAKLQGDIEKALGKPAKKMPPRTNPFMGLPHWIILPNKVGDKLLKGQKMYKPKCVQMIDMGGPKNMPAYVFPGNKNCYVRIESNGKLDFKKSFTIATFVKQQAPYSGPMVEWYGKHPVGTHFWIYRKKTYVNLRPLVRKRGNYFHKTPKSGVWTFVGVSYDYQKGTVLMWTGETQTMIQKPGKFKVDTSGKYVYVGLRPRQKNAFKGQLAGTTLLEGAIEKKEIAKLRADIEKALGKRAPSRKGDFFGLPWWIVTPRKTDDEYLKGQKMTKPACVQIIPNQGPSKMPAWKFPGNKKCYVMIESGGKLDFKTSFTIAAFFYQDVVADGPIVEWSGPGTHFWIYRKKTYVNLMSTVAGKKTSYFHQPAKAKVWTFAGVSYDHTKGELLMWTDEKVTVVHKPGQFNVKTTGNVYLGLRNPKNAFKGLLAGVTLLKGGIKKEELVKLKADIIKKLAPVPAKKTAAPAKKTAAPAKKTAAPAKPTVAPKKPKPVATTPMPTKAKPVEVDTSKIKDLDASVRLKLSAMQGGKCPQGSKPHPLWPKLCRKIILIHLTHKMEDKTCPGGTVPYKANPAMCMIVDFKKFHAVANPKVRLLMRTTTKENGVCPLGTKTLAIKTDTCIITDLKTFVTGKIEHPARFPEKDIGMKKTPSKITMSKKMHVNKASTAKPSSSITMAKKMHVNKASTAKPSSSITMSKKMHVNKASTAKPSSSITMAKKIHVSNVTTKKP